MDPAGPCADPGTSQSLLPYSLFIRESRRSFTQIIFYEEKIKERLNDRVTKNKMAYNSMDSMLMGGIVPSQITKQHVLDFMQRPFKRVKKFSYEGEDSKGNTWEEIILGFPQYGPQDVDNVASVITRFLRVSAQYGFVPGPNTLARLRTARIDLIELDRPLVDIAIRIMKDMRRSNDNRMSSLRLQFLREPSVPKALRLMQFAPGFSYYNNQLLPLPDSLQKKLDKYQNPAKAGAALRRASKRYTSYLPGQQLETFDPYPYDRMPLPIVRTRGDMIPPRAELSAKRRAGLKSAQEKIAARDLAYYQGFDSNLRGLL